MDVHGIRPTSEAGKYFGLNWTGWRPLADYVAEVAPDLYDKVEASWFRNDGHGLNAEDALALADVLESKMDSDAMKQAAALAVEEDDRLRDEYRRKGWPVEPDLESWLKHGIGESWLPDRIRSFAAFLRASGGFEMW
jgi:hypothetical protein